MKTLLLSLLLAAAPTFAAENDVQLYTARAEGSLTIGTDGRVLSVELSSDGNLGEEVLAAYKDRIRLWRFEPVAENGQPVRVTGLMHLSLVAQRVKGSDSTTFGIREVQFLDPPGTPSPGRATSLSPPSFPRVALSDGVGADLRMLLKLDSQGRVVSAAVERLDLLGVSSRQGHLHYFEAQFRRSAERVARSWTFEGFKEHDLVRVPIRYVPPQNYIGWAPVVIRPVSLPDWVHIEDARAQAVELNAGGLALSTQIKLLTPLDGA